MSKSPTHAAYPYLSPKEAAPQAKAAARKALEIDSSLAEAHMALGFSLVVFDWNWAEAEREFEKALELNPNSSVAHYRYGFLYLAPLERYDHAITELKRALELEPLSLITNANLAGAYTFAGQNDLALKQARKTYELEPNFVSGHYWLALAPINLITALRIPEESSSQACSAAPAFLLLCFGQVM